MELIFIILFTIIFAYITHRRFEWGVFLLCLLLPTYLIRFSVGPVPSTLLEVMIITVLLLGLHFRSKQPPLVLAKRDPSTSSPIPATGRDFGRDDKINILLFIGTFLFLLGATISIFTSTNTRAALGEWKAFYVEPILLSAIIISIFNFQFSISKQFHNSSILQFCIFPLILCGLLTSLFSIIQHFTGFFVPDAFWANQNTYRVTAWYGFPNAVGLFLAPLFPLAVYLLKENWNNRHKTEDIRYKIILSSSALFLITSPIAILFAKSTGGLIGLFAGIASLLLFHKKTRLAVCLVGIVGLVSLASLSNANPLKQELLAQNRSGQIHIAIWQETVELLKDHPIVGAGLASYSDKIVPYHKTVNGEGVEIFHHAHNIFLTMWVNLGLAGLVGFLLILVWFYSAGLKKLKIENCKLKIFLLASMTSLLVTGLVDSPYIKNDLSVFFWLLIALMFFHFFQKELYEKSGS